MAKSKSSGRNRTPDRKRGQPRPSRRRSARNRPSGVGWLPYVLGGVLLLAIAVLGGRALLQPEAPIAGPRSSEWLAGVSGISYDKGPTAYRYPDPAGQGDGRQWLPALGRTDAPVVVIEFSDVFCAHCRRFNLDTLPDLLQEYVARGQVRYVDHFFGFAHTVQQGLVMAQFCAAEQGRYFEFKHALFQSVEANALSIDRAARIAGLEMDTFGVCLEERRYAEALQEAVFVDNMGVNSTPTFFINGEMLAGNLPNEIRAMIDAALAAE